MSGIAGLVHTDGRPVAAEDLRAIAAAHPHPSDGVDLWSDGGAGLVRFALRVTPESAEEVQPFVHPGSGAALLFDGRLDNRPELLDLLNGEAAAAAPDGEIVLRLYERFGDAAAHRLVGDYAIALWRPRDRSLHCVRSPVGWRPFLWTTDGPRFGFASEPATLLRGMGLRPDLNEGAAAEYLSGRFATLTETYWKGVHRLAPGGSLTLRDGRVRLLRWFEGPFEDLTRRSRGEHVERFTEAFDAALIAVNRSRGPVASQLSGGLDSSSIVCRSAQLHAAGRLTHAVRPISARFPGQPNDEGFWIEAVERKIGAASHTVSPIRFDLDVTRRWCADTLHLPIRSNALAVFAPVYDAVGAGGGRVLLTGEGGDDWFNGTRMHWADLLVQGRWGVLVKDALDQGGGGGAPGKLLAMSRLAIRPHLFAGLRDRSIFGFDTGEAPPNWIRPDWAARTGLRRRWAQAERPPRLPSLAQYERYGVFMAGRRLNTYDPVVSFAASRGLELRHPLHDLRLARLSMGAAGPMLRRSNITKRVLRDAMQDVLPDEVRTRTSKANFSSSLINTVDERLRERPFAQMLPVRMGWLDPAPIAAVHETYSEWAGNGAQEPFPNASYGVVWNIMAMDIWLEQAFGL